MRFSEFLEAFVMGWNRHADHPTADIEEFSKLAREAFERTGGQLAQAQATATSDEDIPF